MGRVLQNFTNGAPGSISRSVDDIVISIKNAGSTDIEPGTPVFLADNGAEPFSTAAPQEFSDFLGFAVRVADKTPDTYPQSQNPEQFSQKGVWHPGDVMDVLVRGGIVVKMVLSSRFGDKLYLRKNDGQLTPNPGTSGTTLLLENCRIRMPRDSQVASAEVVVTERNAM